MSVRGVRESPWRGRLPAASSKTPPAAWRIPRLASKRAFTTPCCCGPFPNKRPGSVSVDSFLSQFFEPPFSYQDERTVSLSLRAAKYRQTIVHHTVVGSHCIRPSLFKVIDR